MDILINSRRHGDDFTFINVLTDIRNKISALPSADAVSREEYERLEALYDAIRIYDSSAEAVQGWRTGKPTENGEYMVTLDAWGHRYIDVMHYAKPQMPNIEVDGTCWYRDDDEWGDVVYDDSDIIAWMPLPNPYKGGDSE